MTTIREALDTARGQLAVRSETAANDARVLLETVLRVDRAYLIAHDDEPLNDEAAAQYEAFVQRAARGEPLPYMLGRQAFYDREFTVTPDVLIPRPETELLLERALAFAQGRDALTAVDVGTGSGALAVTFAAHVPTAEVYAVDVSTAALAVARQNAAQNGVKVTFIHGNLLAPLIERGVKADLVLANLPYIPTGTLAQLAVKDYEPVLALDGGADGLDLVRRLLAQVKQATSAGALVLLEIEATQGAAAVFLAEGSTGGRVTLHQDYAGLDRIVAVQL